MSVDVKTAAGTRVPERAGHVQNAREAISISLRHTYAVECSVIYITYIYVLLYYYCYTSAKSAINGRVYIITYYTNILNFTYQYNLTFFIIQ